VKTSACCSITFANFIRAGSGQTLIDARDYAVARQLSRHVRELRNVIPPDQALGPAVNATIEVSHMEKPGKLTCRAAAGPDFITRAAKNICS